MNRADGGRSRGYTIIETLIFLAVSGVMFASAVLLVSGRQSHTEFTGAVRDFESTINSIASDVTNGYYSDIAANGSNISCTASSGSFVISSTGSDVQGSNQGCIFIGKAVQFAPTGNDQAYDVVGLIGQQYVNGVSTQGDSLNINQSKVYPLAPANPPSNFNAALDTTTKKQLTGAVSIGCVLYIDDASSTPVSPKPCLMAAPAVRVDTVSFMTTFQPLSYQNVPSDSSNVGGNQQVNLLVAKAAQSLPIGRTPKNAMSDLLTYKADEPPATTGNTVFNPAGGVYICLESNGLNQYALVALGGKSSRFSADVSIHAGSCK